MVEEDLAAEVGEDSTAEVGEAAAFRAEEEVEDVAGPLVAAGDGAEEGSRRRWIV